MDELSSRLRSARGEVRPPRDLWPDIEARMRAPGPGRWQRAAAAVLLFGAGAAAGAMAGRATGRPDAGPAVVLESTTLEAAAAVQRAGSDYVAAVARLHAATAADTLTRAQAHESALGVLAVTAHELETLLEPHGHGALVALTRSAHAAASNRTTAMLGKQPRVNGGGE